MRNCLIFIIALNMLNSCKSEQDQHFIYPETKKVNHVDSYFDKQIADPYRWLEDDRSKETEAWVKLQNNVTRNYVKTIPISEKIKSRLTALWNFTRYTSPRKCGQYYTYYKNDGIQNHSVFYIQEGLAGQPEVLIDPNKLSADGTTSLGAVKLSKDGRYVAYEINKAGSDWSEICIKEIKSGKMLNEVLHWVKFSGIAWHRDGFYYSAYDEPKVGSKLSMKNEFHKVYYHKIGSPQDDDKIVFEDKEHPLRNFNADVTEDGAYLLIYGTESTSGTSLAVKNLKDEKSPIVPLVNNFEHNYTVVLHENNQLYILTDKDAPKYQLLSVNLLSSKPVWNIVIPESTDLLESVSSAGNKFLLLYLKDVSSRLYQSNHSGKDLHELPLPGICKLEDMSTDKDDSLVFFTLNTFTAPASVYKLNLNDNKLQIWYKPKTNFNPNDFETKQVFYPSKDGTKIPMFLTFRKGIKLDGKNPCFIFGYGGFNSYYAPEFRIDRMVFIENGGIYAVPGIRGGGEYGEEWHKAGTKCLKQNVFDDFIAAAEFLYKEKYTQPELTAIHGRSNGGLLIGAVMTQRPDLCKVAIPTVGVMDMLRYHKFTIGWAWATDYGTSDNEEEFNCLLKYSPIHNIKKNKYPATLVTTGDHDDRVVPAHSFKFIAGLQENQTGNLPVMIRIDVNAGHGAGKPTSMQIEEFGDIWSFVCHNLGMSIQ